MNLQDVYPVDSLKEKFDNGINIEYYGMREIEKIAELEPGCLFEIGANAWMHYVESGAKVNPQQLANHFHERDPMIFERVEKVMKKRAIQDVLLVYAHVNDSSLERDICGQLLLAKTYPNNIHISDVEFSNPYEPVSSEERKYAFHNYRSLGLFSELLENILKIGKENRITKVTLSAASNDQVPYFEEHGFSVEDTQFARSAIEMNSGIPMERKCS